MKKKIFRLACCIAAITSVFAFSCCADFFNALFNGSSERSYAEDEWNPNEDASGSSSSAIESEDSVGESSSEAPAPVDPDPEKEILRTETDDIGHKIAYYTDGTSEDLGRETAIDFAPETPINKEGYQYFATLEKGDGLCAFYQELYTVACNFHASSKNVTATGEYYDIAEMKFSQHGLTSDEAVSVWRTVSVEYPEFFWWGNSVLLGERYLNFLIDPIYAQASERAATQTAIERMAYDCDGYLNGTTTKTERALTLHDYVAKITAYAYEDDNITPETEIWAHNIAGGAQYGKGVCESYAKTYDYLCGLFNLPCVTATGYAVQDGESFGHAWNLLSIDGGWYYVDITWNDLDGSTLSREWFGTDPEKFEESHDAFTPEDGWCVNYMYEMPKADEEGLTPVRAANAEDIKGGKYTAQTAPMYPSIEDVCALIGEGITYETYLYPKTSATPTRAEILLDGATLDRVPHTAGTLVINGEYRSVGLGYYELAKLSSPNAITFNGDVVFRDIAYNGSIISLDDNVLTAEGTAVEITATGTLLGGHFVDKTTKWTDLPTVRLTTLTAQGTELSIFGGGTVDRADIHSGILCLSGENNATVTALWFASANEQVYIDGATEKTEIAIGDITAGNATVIPERVTLVIDYTTAKTYPLVRVDKKSTDAKLYLVMRSDESTPQRLGKAFIRLGSDISLSSFVAAYSWHGFTRELAASYYEQLENGDVCLK